MFLTKEEMAARYPEAMWSRGCVFTSREGERLYAFAYAGLWVVVSA